MRFKKGQIREDGKVFIGYHFRKKSGQKEPYWASYNVYHKQKVSHTLGNVRAHSKKHGLPFDLDQDWLLDIFPENSVCPVFGDTMVWGDGDRDSSPSLDRRVPALGYVKGNVSWISMKANRLKSNLTVGDLLSLLNYLETEIL